MRISRLYLIVILSVAAISTGNAQVRNDTTRSVTTFMFNIHLIEPALNFEYGFSKNFSLMLQGGIKPGLLVQFNNNVTSYYYIISPKALAQFRFYYNFNKRVRKGKVTSRNSANYFGLNVHYIFRPAFKNFVDFYPGRFVAGPIWGLQRTSRIGINFNFYVGPAISITEKTNYVKRSGTVHYGNLINFTPVIGVTLGGTVFSTAGKRKPHRIIDFAE